MKTSGDRAQALTCSDFSFFSWLSRASRRCFEARSDTAFARDSRSISSWRICRHTHVVALCLASIRAFAKLHNTGQVAAAAVTGSRIDKYTAP